MSYSNCYENTGIESDNYIFNRLSMVEYLKHYKNIIIILEPDYDVDNLIGSIDRNVVVYIDLQDMCFSPDIMIKLINNSFVKRVFSTNLNYKHEKAEFVPLGICVWYYDFTKLTMPFESPYISCINSKNDDFYQRTLYLNSKNKGLDYKNRKKVISMDFLNGTYESMECPTKKCIYSIREQHFLNFKNRESEFSSKGFAFYRSEVRVDIEDLWNTLSEVVFVISPPGNGYDTHRTYENLILGNIPILLRHPDIRDEGFFERVGCILVGDYSEITPEFLDNYIETHTYSNKINEELLMRYWVQKVTESIKDE